MARQRARTAVATALAALLVGCARSERVEVEVPDTWYAATSLLRRTPDEVLLPAGLTVPGELATWSTPGAEGWHDKTYTRDDLDGLPYLWMTREKALLLLPAGPPTDRALRLRTWCIGTSEQPTQTATIHLNGEAVGDVVASRAVEEHVVEVAAEAWRDGTNFLEIEVDELREMSSTGRRYGLAVAEVAWEDVRPARVHPGAAELVLTPGSGVEYAITPVARTRVHVVAETTGPGELTLELVDVAVADGSLRGVADTSRIAVERGAIDRHVDVPETPEGTTWLRLRWHSSGGHDLAFGELRVEETEEVARPPIVLIAIDTFSARHVGAYGYERETTPNLDAFAEQAVLFEHCVSNGTWTLPSFASMMSGLFAEAGRRDVEAEPGVRVPMWDRWALATNRWTLAESLRAGGRTTGAFVDSSWLTARYGFTQGFDHFDDSASDASRFSAGEPDGGLKQAGLRALEWIDTLEGRPFFAFLHSFDLHGPYAGGEFRGRFRDDALAEKSELRPAGGISNAFGTIPEYVAKLEFPEQPMPTPLPTGPIVSAYDEGLAMTDAIVGWLFDELRARGVFDEALIVVTADHGETMADTEFLFGHSVLDEACAHIPLIVKLPHQEEGRRVAQTVQLVDVFPTLLDAAGMDAPRGDLHGRSLMPLLEGQSLPEVPALTETGIMSQSALYFDGWKLVVQRPGESASDVAALTLPDEHRDEIHERFPVLRDSPLTEELLEQLRKQKGFRRFMNQIRDARAEPIVKLYRIREDRAEQSDLADREPERVAELTAMLEREIARREEARARAVADGEASELSAEDIAELEALGYMGE